MGASEGGGSGSGGGADGGYRLPDGSIVSLDDGLFEDLAQVFIDPTEVIAKGFCPSLAELDLANPSGPSSW